MLVSPSKIKKHRLVKNRTLNFETVKKTHQNLVLIAADTNVKLEAIIMSKLFRPQQMMSIFVPRMIRPMGRKALRLNQKDYYAAVKQKTNGKIKIGKNNANIYNGLNVIYNTVPEYAETVKMAGRIKSGVLLQKYMYGYFETLMKDKMDEMEYEKNYLVIPMIDYIPGFKAGVLSNHVSTDPLLLFMRSMKRNTMDIELYKKFDLIMFFNPNANAMYVIDMKEFDVDKDFTIMFSKVNRLNSFNNGEDDLEEDDGILVDNEEDLDDDDQVENMKDDIKNLVLSKIAKKIKANNLTDFEAANKDEQDIMLAIDRKIEKYLEDPANLDKPFAELAAEIERDQEVKAKAIRYVETKKLTIDKLAQLSANLDKETEIIGSLDDLDLDETSIEPDRFEVDGVDERVKTSTLSSLDEEYNKKQFKKDMMSILSGFSSSYYLPMTIDSFRMEDTSDDFKQVDTIFVKFRTDEGKLLSFSLDIPKIVDKRYFFLGGNKKVLTKQLVRLPIVKTKPDRVEITTNYNKITIERTNGKLSRRNSYLMKILKDIKNDKIIIEFGSNNIINDAYKSDFEYEELAGDISRIKNPKYEVIFNRKELKEEIDMMDIDEKFFTEDMTPIGFNRIKGTLLYLEKGKVFEYGQGQIAENIFALIYEKILGRTEDMKLPKIGKSFVYTKMKILGEAYPIFVVIGLLNGITDILKRYKVKYKLSPEKLKIDPNYVEVKFQDKYLYYEDIIQNTLLFNVLYTMGTEEYEFSDFDTDGPFTDYFVEKLDQPIYIRNTLRINLNVMIDPITKEVLKDLKLPTDPIDLLLLANTMLTTSAYRPQNDIRNFRVRGNEIVNAMMYQLISDAYVKYQRGKLNGRNVETLDIPRNKLVSKLLMEPNVNDHSTLNPVLELENIASVSAKGFRGINLGSAYTLELRAYDQSMVGIIAGNATPFGPNSGVTRGLSYNPKLNTVRGYIPDIENKLGLEPTNILSPAEMMSSFTSTMADPPRQAMNISQTKHTMPVVKTHKQLIGSGVNKTMAFMISDDFVFKAKEDGYIEKIDNDNQLAILLYKSGKKDAIDLSETLVKNSNSGFFIKQKFLISYAEGEKFKKGEAIAYNPAFFTGKGMSMDYKPGTFAKIAISPIDLAYEDSTMISESLSKKAASNVTMQKQVSLGVNTIVHSIAEVGQTVKTGDSLLDFTTSFEDPATAEFLADLSRTLGSNIANTVGNEHITAKYTGKIVDIKIYYNKPLTELHESLVKLIKKYRGKVQKRKQALVGIKTASVHIPPLEQQSGDKIGQEKYEGVIIEFYIEYFDIMTDGDKLVFNTALKAVIARTVAIEESPISEYRQEEHIEAILSPTGVISRMTSDVYSMLYGNKVLIEVGKQIKEILNDER